MNLGFLSSPNRWAAFMIGLWALLTITYIVWHITDVPGCKYVPLSPAEIADIGSILDQKSQRAAPNTSPKQPQEPPSQSLSVISPSFDSLRLQVYDYIVSTHEMNDSVRDSWLSRDKPRPAPNEANYKHSLQSSMNLMPDAPSLKAFLTTHPIRVYSPYHLEGRKLLWELICWAWFGVFCSLFYNVSEAYKGANIKPKPADSGAAPSDQLTLETIRTASGDAQPLFATNRVERRLLNGFDPAEVPSHIAKLIYTPFLIVVFYLYTVTFGSADDLRHVQIGEGVIVFAFVLGFFSGRMVDLLENVKELLFRWGSQQSLRTPAPAAGQMGAGAPGNPPVPVRPVPAPAGQPPLAGVGAVS